MKKTTKKSSPKASKKTAKDLEVKPAKGGAVRGGWDTWGNRKV